MKHHPIGRGGSAWIMAKMDYSSDGSNIFFDLRLFLVPKQNGPLRRPYHLEDPHL